MKARSLTTYNYIMVSCSTTFHYCLIRSVGAKRRASRSLVAAIELFYEVHVRFELFCFFYIRGRRGSPYFLQWAASTSKSEWVDRQGSKV
jgi:hypothetical protein